MINGKTIKAIIPARMTSSRLPGKVLMNLAGKPNLQRMVDRVKASKLLDGIVIAITTNPADDCLEEFCRKNDCECFRGSENNVLERLIGAAKATNTDIVVEATSDCPLLWHQHIDYLIDLHMQSYPEYDLTTNIQTRSFSRGFDIRIVNIEALERSFTEIDNQPDFEHALTWIYLHPQGKLGYKVQNWEAQGIERRPDLQLTLDTQADLEFLNWIYSFSVQGYNLQLSPVEIINLLDVYGHLEICQAAKNVPRKDYFQELQEWYALLNNMEQSVLNGNSSEEEPIGILKRSEKHDDKFQVYNPNGRTEESKRKPGRPKK